MDLHPELNEWIVEGWINHPLLSVSVDGSNRRINKLYEVRKCLRDVAKNDSDWRNFVNIHEPHFRMLALTEVHSLIPNDEYYKLAGEIWNSVDVVTVAGEFHSLVFLESAHREDLHKMMTIEEREALANLDEEFAVYRAHQEFNQNGFCWTTEKGIAFEYCDENNWNCITEGKIAKKDVWAFFLRRSEFEIIAFPETVRDKNRVK